MIICLRILTKLKAKHGRMGMNKRQVLLSSESKKCHNMFFFVFVSIFPLFFAQRRMNVVAIDK